MFLTSIYFFNEVSMLYIKLSYIEAPKVIPLASFFILTVFNSYISNFKTKNYFKKININYETLNLFKYI